MMANAIGKPTSKAPEIVNVNAKSRFSSWRTLSMDMPLTRNVDKSQSCHPTYCGETAPLTLAYSARKDVARIWLTNH